MDVISKCAEDCMWGLQDVSRVECILEGAQYATLWYSGERRDGTEGTVIVCDHKLA